MDFRIDRSRKKQYQKNLAGCTNSERVDESLTLTEDTIRYSYRQVMIPSVDATD